MQSEQTKLYTKSNIDRFVEERMASKRNQPKFSLLSKQSQVSQPIQADSNTEAVRQLLFTMKWAKKTLAKESSLGKKKADQIHSDHFFKEVIKNMGDDSNGFHNENDLVEDI